MTEVYSDPYRPDLECMVFENWGTTHELYVEAGRYVHGNGLFLQLYEKGDYDGLEPYANLTVNLMGYSCGKNCAYVDTNNFPEAITLISEYKLGKRTGNIGVSGYCNYPEYEFDMTEIKRFCLNPEELFNTGMSDKANTVLSPDKSKKEKGAR